MRMSKGEKKKGLKFERLDFLLGFISTKADLTRVPLVCSPLCFPTAARESMEPPPPEKPPASDTWGKHAIIWRKHREEKK